LPKDYVPPAAPEKAEVEEEPQRMCPICGSPMRCGFLVEANAPLTLTTMGEGVYWSPGEWGTLGDRVPLKSYACPSCGKVELCVRWLRKYRGTIESARYVCE
jgi:RNA polymerase subunit RPABC4/transcription elongation factor Spt4